MIILILVHAMIKTQQINLKQTLLQQTYFLIKTTKPKIQLIHL